MAPIATVAHYSNGRTRLKVPNKLWDKEYFREVQEVLSKLPGVETVKTNPSTGSILVVHDLDLLRLLQAAEERDLFQVMGQRLPVTPATEDLETALKSVRSNLNREIKDITGGEIDFHSVVAAAYFGLSLVQIRRKSFFPAAWVLAMHGLDTLRQRA